RRVYGRHRAAPRGFCHRGSAARHGADRDAAVRTLATFARTGPLLRWRCGRPAGGLAGAASRPAPAAARPQLAFCDLAAGRGPGLADPRPRPAGLWRGAHRGTTAGRGAVAERVIGSADRHARTPRRSRTTAAALGKLNRRPTRTKRIPSLSARAPVPARAPRA